MINYKRIYTEEDIKKIYDGIINNRIKKYPTKFWAEDIDNKRFSICLKYLLEIHLCYKMKQIQNNYSYELLTEFSLGTPLRLNLKNSLPDAIQLVYPNIDIQLFKHLNHNKVKYPNIKYINTYLVIIYFDDNVASPHNERNSDMFLLKSNESTFQYKLNKYFEKKHYSCDVNKADKGFRIIKEIMKIPLASLKVV